VGELAVSRQPLAISVSTQLNLIVILSAAKDLCIPALRNNAWILRCAQDDNPLLKHRCERLKDQRRQLCRFCCPFETQIVTGTVNFQQFRPGGNQLPSFFYLLNTPNGSRVPWTNRLRVRRLGRC